MLAKALSTALVSGLLLTGGLSLPAFANSGGGDAPVVADYYKQPHATLHNPDGSSVTVRKNADGSRTIIHRNARGKVVKTERVERRRPAAGNPKPRELPSATSHDRRTGVTTTVRGNRDGSRTITKTDRNGRVISKQTVGNPKVKINSAASRDVNTGVVRAAITIGLIGFGLSLMP